MKKLWTIWTIAAAALTVAAGTASAQVYRAEIPLSFRAQQKLMVPGTYEIRVASTSGHPMFHIYNVNTHSAVVVLGYGKSDAPRAWLDEGRPVLSFECSGGLCALSRIWNGEDSFAYDFPGLKLPRGERRLAVVNVTLSKAD